jgi:outer membrane protein assembly factor BamB
MTKPFERADGYQDCLDDPSPVIGPDGSTYGRGWGGIFAINPDGSLRWAWEWEISAPSTLSVELALARDGGRLYTIDIERAILTALRTSDGQIEWEVLISEHLQAEVSAASAPVILADDTVFIVASGKLKSEQEVSQLFLLTFSRDGTLKGSVEVLLPLPPGYVAMFPLFSRSPVIRADGTIYISVKIKKNRDFIGSSLYALDPEGKVIWDFTLELEQFKGEPVLGPDGTIYFGTWWVPPPYPVEEFPPRSTFYALSAEGELKWKFVIPEDGSVWGTPAIGAEGIVYLPTTRVPFADEGVLYALSPEGEVLWEFKAEGNLRSSPVIAQDGTLYFVMDTYHPDEEHGGRLYAIQTSSLGLASSPWPMYRGDPQHSGQVRLPPP